MPNDSTAGPLPLPEAGGELTPQAVFAAFDDRHKEVMASMPEVAAALQQERQAHLDAIVAQQKAFWEGVNTRRQAAESAIATQEAAPVVEPTPQQSRWRRIGATVLSSVSGFAGRIRARAESTRRHDPMTIESPGHHPIEAAREDGGLLLDPVSTALDPFDRQPQPVFSDIWELLQTRETLVDGLDRTGDREPALPQPVMVPGQRVHWDYIPDERAASSAPQPGKDTTLPVRTPGMAPERYEQQALPPDTTQFMADDARQRAPATTPNDIMGIVIANARAASPVAQESLERKSAALLYNRGLDPATRRAVLTRIKRNAAAAKQPLPTVAAFDSAESNRLIARPMTAPDQQPPHST